MDNIALALGHARAAVNRQSSPRGGGREQKANKDGSTPLFIAVWNGHEAVVELLIAAKADRSIQRVRSNLRRYFAKY